MCMSVVCVSPDSQFPRFLLALDTGIEGESVESQRLGHLIPFSYQPFAHEPTVIEFNIFTDTQQGVFLLEGGARASPLNPGGQMPQQAPPSPSCRLDCSQTLQMTCCEDPA